MVGEVDQDLRQLMISNEKVVIFPRPSKEQN